ncbi:hypothetical protein CXB51_005239 [Gossypium anomalum]|uniref:Uncharacterized protein n=1 Tax=Gossypium anomalum TaxID=47600 RepID=A0A8J5ZHL3_9ROSI|nr:hypothetical protein CXB51_005239 [Gossypium anomalum]
MNQAKEEFEEGQILSTIDLEFEGHIQVSFNTLKYKETTLHSADNTRRGQNCICCLKRIFF